MPIFDTHCHLSAPELRVQITEVLERCHKESVQGLALISADFESLKDTEILQKEISALAPQMKVVRSAGIHPHDAKIFWESGTFDESRWQEVTRSEKMASAIGETGLDFHYNNSEANKQKILFSKHIDLACESSKPLVIHCREAAADVLNSLDREDLRKHPNPGILHCFAEDIEFAKKVIDWGFYVSFSGIITFKNAQRLREVATWAPLDRILVETDSPWLAPIPFRGKTNEPSYVPHVLKLIQNLRSEAPEAIAAQIWQNSCRMFSC